MSMKTVNRINIALAMKNKTKKWLAEELEMNAGTVSRWANNHQQPSMQTLGKIAKLLQMDVKELIEVIEVPDQKK